MQFPLEITFHGIESSLAVEARIRDKAAKLAQYCNGLIRTEVVVEAPHRHHHMIPLYHVRIALTVPGATLVADREPHRRFAHEDVFIAIRDAFDDATRQLEDWARRRRGDVKSHAGETLLFQTV